MHLFIKSSNLLNIILVYLWQEQWKVALKKRRYRKLCYFLKFFINKQPPYLFNLIPTRTFRHGIRITNKIPLLNLNITFQKLILSSSFIEWNKVDPSFRDSSSFPVFKKGILKFINPTANSFFNCGNSKGIKLVAKIRLGLSHLCENKFKHSFKSP